MAPHTPKDLRTGLLDILCLTAEDRLRLAGLACARCGGTDTLLPGGHAYTRSPDGTRLGWAVKTCAPCLNITSPQGT